MNLTIPKIKLARYLSYADVVASSKTTVPVLSNVLLDAGEDSLSIHASNLETGMRVTDKASVGEKGAIAVNGKKLYSIVRELPDDDVIMTTDEHNRLTVKSASSEINVKFIVSGIARDEFPDVRTEPETEYIQIRAEEFRKMLRKVIFSISSDESKYSLTGMFVEKQDDGLNMVATDGKRLSLVQKFLSALGTSPELFNIAQEGVIIPRIVLTEIIKYQFEKDEMRIGFSRNQVFFSYDNVSIASNLIEGKFPDYKKIIPGQREQYFIAQKTPLSNAIKRVSLLVDESYNQIKLSVLKNRLLLSSKNPALGGAAEEIQIQYSGEDIDIALNYLYLAECLREIDSESVKIDFENAERVITIRGTDEEGYVNLIMPMKINL